MIQFPIKRISLHPSSGGFMLLEVLIALALFGMSAVFLVEGVGLVSKEIVNRKNVRDLEGDLVWIRAQIFEQNE